MPLNWNNLHQKAEDIQEDHEAQVSPLSQKLYDSDDDDVVDRIMLISKIVHF